MRLANHQWDVSPLLLIILRSYAERLTGEFLRRIGRQSSGSLGDVQYHGEVIRVSNIRLFEIDLDVLKAVPVQKLIVDAQRKAEMVS